MTAPRPSHPDPLDEFLDGTDIARNEAKWRERLQAEQGDGVLVTVTVGAPNPTAKPRPLLDNGNRTPSRNQPAARRPTERARPKPLKTKVTYEIDAELVDEIKDAAVARMVDGDTVNSLAEDALRHGLAHLRDLYFDGQAPPPRARNPRPGRRPYN